ncbi:uncharacterized protein LOC103508870 [Diaphorina citri]|uniref:Uncharacterized protein LOC103508870 n=1 Tax=Diaphorina citri TaxID=121845 RepID=A0A1S3D1Y2_DIACI|nr:uncharacterized protein LOC103508870 [Diaphorina citri]
MDQLIRGSFGNSVFKHICHSKYSLSALKLVILKCHHGVQQYRTISQLSRSSCDKQLFMYRRIPLYSTPVHRGYAMVVAKVLKGVLDNCSRHYRKSNCEIMTFTSL